VPNIELAGGVPVRVPLKPGSFRPDLALIAAAMTPKTCAIIVNSHRVDQRRGLCYRENADDGFQIKVEDVVFFSGQVATWVGLQSRGRVIFSMKIQL
jgi:hypothetical protein